MGGKGKAAKVVVGLGIAIAVFTVLSGIVASIAGFHGDSPITREVFEHIPGPLKVVFYTVIPVMVIWGAFMFSNRMKNWERGTPS